MTTDTLDGDVTTQTTRRPPTNPIIGKQRADEWDGRFEKIEKDTVGISNSLSVLASDVSVLRSRASTGLVLAVGAVIIVLQVITLIKPF